MGPRQFAGILKDSVSLGLETLVRAQLRVALPLL